jgi:ferredoxin
MKFIANKEINHLLNTLLKEKAIVAPAVEEGVLRYKEITRIDQIADEYTRPVMSLKEIFFPPTESLIKIYKGKDSVQIKENLSIKDTVIFGARSCDTKGLVALDRVFLETPPIDQYYQARRNHTTIIGLACKEMADTCFCTSVDGKPDDSTGMDILLTEVDGGYILDVITSKGKDLIQESELQEFKGDRPVPQIHTPTRVPPEDIWRQVFKSELWEKEGERCISCRICAYVCPTCRCFDVRDELLPSTNNRNAYNRIRCWDSCAGETYRMIAGGHNPRIAKGDRLRNRILCKFYYYNEQYSATACTGCGRCIDACPVNIDITEILGQLAEVQA